ncbi:ATP-dependent Clp protease ATP-binding subunit [Klebsormidium nitens]|uniref:ATP-dependent Clp protease ATP-binding subunit n=1 Tax=Klebsormidium nitens TaxID=105231 RepID=A0A1Y1HX29_KLENI|nr:ATP-dependent Clp protease ATP-binding subunit [Klebsormidium nitens]|eukprot:GAQ82703.1 ATP-dependent Clp protease ATP-binding subunit [Klebsormidium nitens]
MLDASCTGLRRECTLDRLSRSVAGPSSLLASLAAATSVRHRGGARRGVIVAIFEKFTERAIKAVMNSQKEAKALGKREVGTAQLFLGLVAEARGEGGFLRTGLTVERAREAMRQITTPESSAGGMGEIPFSAGCKNAFEAASDESKRLGNKYISPEHLLVGLVRADDGGASKLIERLGLRKEKLEAEAVDQINDEHAKETRGNPSPASERATAGVGVRRSAQTSRKGKGALDNFCVDITARAAEGKIDPVIGRAKEVQRVVEILARRTKNNPILLGEPGVGKTAIAEGLALRIVKDDVPEFLNKKRVMSLDMGLLIAGAKERGELETRVTSLVEETKTAGDVILMIDEVHTLVGSGSVSRGSGGGGLDIANLLKPALARGLLQCIGATTLDEHRKHIEKDKALARRFQPVMVLEPSEADAKLILRGIQDKYEVHHKCKFSPQAVDAAVELSARYIADRFLPDKAIDLLDEAGSRARISAFNMRKQRQTSVLSAAPADIWAEIRAVQKQQQSALVLANEPSSPSFNLFEEAPSKAAIAAAPGAADISELDAAVKRAGFSTFWEDEEDVVVGLEDIAAVASIWSGVPVQQLTTEESARLVDLEDTLRTRVIGQDDAVSAIARAVRRARVGLKDPKRPIAAMLFSGPTGVGKTELTKALAEQYFGSEDAMIRLDMSEFMERHTVSKLVGAPPGYVGYGEGGVLTEAVRRRPFTVILLDEIEKAHPDVFNMLLQIFEDGRLTDSQGRAVSFKNTLIVMTSNIGSKVIARGGSNQLGFVLPTAEADGGAYSRMKAMVMEEMKAYFRPELLNRLDEVVVFKSLEKAEVRSIVALMLAEVKARCLSERRLQLEVTDSVVTKICEEGYDRSYGARPLRRKVTALVEDALSEYILVGGFLENDSLVVDLDAAGEVVVSHQASHEEYVNAESLVAASL